VSSPAAGTSKRGVGAPTDVAEHLADEGLLAALDEVDEGQAASWSQRCTRSVSVRDSLISPVAGSQRWVALYV